MRSIFFKTEVWLRGPDAGVGLGVGRAAFADRRGWCGGPKRTPPSRMPFYAALTTIKSWASPIPAKPRRPGPWDAKLRLATLEGWPTPAAPAPAPGLQPVEPISPAKP